MDDSFISTVLSFFCVPSLISSPLLSIATEKPDAVSSVGLAALVGFRRTVFVFPSPPPISPKTHQCPITKSNQVVLQRFAVN